MVEALLQSTKRVAAGILIELDAVEKAAFDNVKDTIASAVTRSFPDDTATTCLLTDASDMGWTVIVTQVKNFDIKTPVQDQQRYLLECLRGTFTGSQLNWIVIKKKAFPIACACAKLDYLLLRPQGFRMFCDHRNLIHVFAPDAGVKKHVKGESLRWSMKVMNFNYIIEHIAGPHNVWAHMVSRWAGNHTLSATTIKHLRADAAHQEPVVATVLPSTPPCDLLMRKTSFGQLWWISRRRSQCTSPTAIRDSPLRFPRTPGRSCHGRAPTSTFRDQDLHSLVSTFVRQCRLCLNTEGGVTIPRPWGETIECSERNDVLHFDYLSMGESFGDSKYLLVLKDHASHYCELVIADTADSMVTVEALLAWHSNLGSHRHGVDEKSGNKLLVTSVGPYRVVRADAHSFRGQHLITGAELHVHTSRLKFYSDSSLNVTEGRLAHISSQGIVLAIEKLEDHRLNSKINDYEILVQWRGLKPIEDSYEPLSSLARDIKRLVKQYVATADQQWQEHWQRVATGGEQQQRLPAASAPAQERRRKARGANGLARKTDGQR
ncbi:unnamed protein product [Phytophthora fragariaefolia]|uniref:Unnamed protein product n=1 Tax=Phytophthora fragariaefolia TaxID=1490495 RepID=A0A9W6XJL9_9STRA|nr:unnamed protein product [Phytophthora fragariaefolia]